MTADDRRLRRAQFLNQLAARDLYAWLGIASDAPAEAVRAAAERKRRELSGTPMTQAKRATERAYVDQGEKVLLRPEVRAEYDELLRRRRAPAPGLTGGAARERAEREARLTAARERVQRYGPDDAHMEAGSAMAFDADAAQEELAAERRAAARLTNAAEVLAAARAARAQGAAARGLALAERAHALAPSPATLTTLGSARRDVGDLAGSEEALRASVRELPRLSDNARGAAALAATLRARGAFREAVDLAEALIEEDEEDAYGWRVLALAAADAGDADRAAEAWERSVQAGLDAPTALAGLQRLRKDHLARNDRAGATEVELRMSRMRGR
jgi:hypothetical protein